MNSLQRVVETVHFRPTDRVPVIAQVFGHAAVRARVPLHDYLRCGETLARCQMDAQRHYGYDAVFSVMGTGVETEAAGSALWYIPDQYPEIETYALDRDSDPDRLVVPDPQTAGRMPEMLKALSILRNEIGDSVLVVGCVLGPFTIATQLLGMENALLMAADEPERFERVLDFSLELAVSFGKAQVAAGAHLPVVFDPSASPVVIPPRFFREFELPRLKRLFDALTAAGAAASWLHAAGPAETILPYYPEAGVNIANFDYEVTPEEAMSRLPDRCLDGNVRSLAFLEETAGEVREVAARLIAAFRRRGGFIHSSGCEIPPESAPENVAALVEASRAGR